MKRSLVLASLGLLLAAPRALGGPGEVTAVSVLPGPGSVNVVIDVRGGVQVSDFTLKEPARLVVDVKGATLRTRGILYDRINRGGILNIRYSQFSPEIVRVVIELESLRDYRLEHADDAVRIAIGTDRGFTAWSSVAPAAMGFAPRKETPVAEPPVAEPVAAPAPVIPAAARRPLSSLQGQQPAVISVSLDSATIDEVVA